MWHAASSDEENSLVTLHLGPRHARVLFTKYNGIHPLEVDKDGVGHLCRSMGASTSADRHDWGVAFDTATRSPAAVC